MTAAASDIERIVRQVLAELGLAERGADVPPANGAGAPPASGGETALPPKPALDPAEWTVTNRVVTLRDLPELWNGVRRVVVPARAVVTPAVRDELDRKRVALAFAEASPPPRGDRPAVLVTAVGSYDPAALAKALADDGFAPQVERTQCLIVATEGLARGLSGGRTAGLLLTKHPAAALCLANRLAGVRAVLGTSAERAAADADAVGANLLVLDTQAQGFFPLRQTARRFLRGAPRACPEVFTKQLG